MAAAVVEAASTLLGSIELPRLVNNTVKMSKGYHKKPKGNMSADAFFVQTCRRHKKKNPEVPGNFAEFSKKCSERWKTMPGKEKSKFDETPKADKVRWGWEVKDYGPAKGAKKRTLMPPKGRCLDSSYSVQNSTPKIKSTNAGIAIQDVAKKLGKMWNNFNDSEKQSYNNKAAKLKKYENDVVDIRLKETLMAQSVPLKLPKKRWKRNMKKTRRKKEEDE